MTTEMFIVAAVIAASNVASLILGMLVGRALWKKEGRKW